MLAAAVVGSDRTGRCALADSTAAFPRRLTAGTVGAGPMAWDEAWAFLRGGSSSRCPGFGPDGRLAQTCIASDLAVAVCPSLPSRSAVPLTRLETRTKESNTYASHWVV